MILLQQLTAGFFLALFVFIHVVKLTHHHHSTQPVAKANEFEKQIRISTDCSVCDYYFVKDSHNQTNSLQIEAPHPTSPSYADFFSPRITSIGLHSSDRGPPSLV